MAVRTVGEPDGLDWGLAGLARLLAGLAAGRLRPPRPSQMEREGRHVRGAEPWSGREKASVWGCASGLPVEGREHLPPSREPRNSSLQELWGPGVGGSWTPQLRPADGDGLNLRP